MDTEQLSVFVFIDSLVVSASQDAGGYPISRQKKTASCIWVAIPVDWVILPHFLTHGAPLRESSTKIYLNSSKSKFTTGNL